MSRPLLFCFALFAFCALLVPGPVLADDDVPKVASDEQAEAALDVFKQEFKAKGLKGDEKLMQRDWAMRELAKVQHPDVVTQLGKLTKHGNSDVRTLAVIYLGEMRAFPGLAGKRVMDAVKKNRKDPVLVMSGLQSVGALRFLGGQGELRDFIKDRDYALRKYAIRTIGDIGDVRMIGDLLKILGIDLKNEKQQGDGNKDEDQKKSGKEEVVEEGYSWEGVEVFYDTGTAGDGDQKMAEKLGKEKLAQNKAQAQAGAGKGSGGGPSTGGSAGPRGGSSRTVEELVPTILKALYRMTGEKLETGAEIKAWMRANKDQLAGRCELLDLTEKEQAKGK